MDDELFESILKLKNEISTIDYYKLRKIKEELYKQDYPTFYLDILWEYLWDDIEMIDIIKIIGGNMNLRRVLERKREKKELEEIKKTYGKKPKEKCPKCGKKSLFMKNSSGELFCIRCDKKIKEAIR